MLILERGCLLETKLIGRISVEQEANGILLRIPSPKDWKIPFLAVWLAFWLIAPRSLVMQAFHSLGQPKSIQWFNVVWTVGWAFGVCYAVWGIAWSLAGIEFLRLTPSDMEFTRSLFGVVFKQRHSVTAEVRNLRYTPGRYGGHNRYQPAAICYEDNLGTVRVGSGINEAGALAVIDQMLLVYSFPKRDKALEYMDLGS